MGIDYIHQFETYEINCSDKFISWGWKYKYKNVFPLTQPALNLKLKKKQKRNLLVMGNYPSFPTDYIFNRWEKKELKKCVMKL